MTKMLGTPPSSPRKRCWAKRCNDQWIGGGTGLRYSYVDLALLDAEWIGIWPDSPPPPS